MTNCDSEKDFFIQRPLIRYDLIDGYYFKKEHSNTKKSLQNKCKQSGELLCQKDSGHTMCFLEIIGSHAEAFFKMSEKVGIIIKSAFTAYLSNIHIGICD